MVQSSDAVNVWSLHKVLSLFRLMLLLPELPNKLVHFSSVYFLFSNLSSYRETKSLPLLLLLLRAQRLHRELTFVS